MALLITSIILTAITFIFLGVRIEEDEFDKKIVWGFTKRQFLSVSCLIICIFGFVAKIPANNVGIVYSPFGGTKEETLSEGIHKKNIFDKVYKISTEVQTTTVKDLTTQTKDAQFLTSVLDIKYCVNADDAHLVFKQYRTLEKLSDSLIVPTTQRVLELVTTRYNVIDILGEKRADVYSEFEKSLGKEFEKYGVKFYSISIVDMDAGAALEKAISDEAVAKKDVETAEQKLLKTQTESKEKVVKAQADQEAAKIKAKTKIIEAEAEQKANKLINESLSDKVLNKAWVDKWDGKMPTYYGGADGAGIMFNVGK